MVEPPGDGFTGVVWEARPTERLARELTTGPGSVPMAEAASAWGRLAANFGAAVVDYDRIVAEIRGHWQSDRSDEVLERIARMRDWLLDAATAAGRNAAHAAEQAAAYEVARLAMPHIAEIAALEQAMHTVQAIGAAMGAPLVGAAADISADQDVAKAGAARVMRTYEAATEPLAMPWQQIEPPVLATGDALAGEQAAAAVAAESAPAMPAIPGMPAMPNLAAFDMPRTLTGTRVQTVAQVTRPTEFTALQASPAQTGTATGQAVPAAAGPAAVQSEEERVARAGAADAPAAGEFEIDAGLAAAPAVLGGVETPPASGTASPA
ncbi:PPE domain-containing protein [Nocardia sp. NRRL WC-3656]|uniref:PPE domain-containing protein n=1 Tax=Nocardia sp. NRRL WC-3656 TaxID=1463824 RepID=UPI0004C3C75F|nr:PPE domain-containing protein [Nocardia sp. NRRL WC-3656]